MGYLCLPVHVYGHKLPYRWLSVFILHHMPVCWLCTSYNSGIVHQVQYYSYTCTKIDRIKPPPNKPIYLVSNSTAVTLLVCKSGCSFLAQFILLFLLHPLPFNCLNSGTSSTSSPATVTRYGHDSLIGTEPSKIEGFDLHHKAYPLSQL